MHLISKLGHACFPFVQGVTAFGCEPLSATAASGAGLRGRLRFPVEAAPAAVGIAS